MTIILLTQAKTVDKSAKKLYNNDMDTLLLIDGNSLINRAYYALPPLTNDEGGYTHAVFGFTTMLVKAIADFKPRYIAVAFDLPEPTFRHKMYDGYKATRKKMPDELAEQLPLLKRELSLMNISIVEKPGYEADDVIGTLAADETVRTYIITGDRDSFQLIDDTTSVVYTKRGISDVGVYDEAKLKEEYGLTPRQVIEFKALAGDSSDNIPGVAGVGEKTALGYLERYGDLDGVYEHIDEIKGKSRDKLIEGKETAYLSKTLATIDRSVPLDVTTSDFTFDFPFGGEVLAFFEENKFRSLVKREELFTSEAAQTKATSTTFIEKTINGGDSLRSALDGVKVLAFCEDDDAAYFALGRITGYRVPKAKTLADEGVVEGAVTKAFGELLSDPDVRKIVYDAKKLRRRYEGLGYELCGYDDVKLMQFISDPRAVGETASDFAEKRYGDEKCPAAKLFAAYESLKDELKGRSAYDLYEKVELPLEEILVKMEDRGVKVNVELLEELGKEYVLAAEKLEEAIYVLAGKPFNIKSTKQLADVLFNDLLIPYPKKGSKRSTSAEILEEIEDKHEIVPLVEKYRSLTKINSTYVDGLKKLCDENGVVHTEYNQTVAATGRLSSAEPNIQNIPVREEEWRVLRGLFVAREGYVLVSADYSQIELRLLAHLSGDEKMIELYREGADIHTRTAAEVFGVSESEVTSAMRRTAKTVNFGIIYGISDFGLAKSLKLPLYKAREYMRAYFERFPKVKPYFDSVVAEAKKTGYTTSMLGRRRYIPELKSPNYAVRQFGERAAMNMPLQGSAADVIKLAMVDVEEKLKGMKSKMILQIHDELIVEAAVDEVEEVKKRLRDGMENAARLSVPLTVDVESGKSWLDC